MEVTDAKVPSTKSKNIKKTTLNSNYVPAVLNSSSDSLPPGDSSLIDISVIEVSDNKLSG